MVNAYHARYKDSPWYKPLTISIGGVGALGSALSFTLARLGHTLYVYDDDIIESVNVGSQMYKTSSIGKRKDENAAEIALEFSGNGNVIPAGKFTEDSPASNIMIAAFDNMKYRKLLAEKWFNYQKSKTDRNPKEVNLFLDLRGEAETAILYTVKSPKDYDRYVKELFDDSQVPDAPCTFRASSHNPGIIAGLAIATLNNHITNKLEGQKFREVPFKITYELPTLTFDVIR